MTNYWSTNSWKGATAYRKDPGDPIFGILLELVDQASASDDSNAGALAEVYCAECGNIMYLRQFPDADVVCSVCIAAKNTDTSSFKRRKCSSCTETLVSKSEVKTGTCKECRILKLNKESTAKWEKIRDDSKAEYSKAKNAILISTEDDDSADETYQPDQKKRKVNFGSEKHVKKPKKPKMLPSSFLHPPTSQSSASGKATTNNNEMIESEEEDNADLYIPLSNEDVQHDGYNEDCISESHKKQERKCGKSKSFSLQLLRPLHLDKLQQIMK